MAAKSATERTDWQKVRSSFPFFKRNPGTIFLDSASTTQKPESVLRAISTFYRKDCANAGRATYGLSTQLASEIEASRNKVAEFINADPDGLVFSSGATESLNTVALGWGLTNLEDGDEIMLCMEDHKSTVLPWLNLKTTLARLGKEIKIVPFKIHREGDYDLKDIASRASERTRLIALTHVHHLYGMDMEVEEIRSIVGADVLISLDACQSIGHRKVDVQSLGVDFLSFSGHKMFALNGIGALWIGPKVRDRMLPLKPGGGLNDKEGEEGSSLRAAYEGGTANIPGILSLKKAIQFIESLGMDEIEGRIHNLTRKLYFSIKDLEGIQFSPGFGQCACPQGFGILAFRFEQVPSIDLAFALESEYILLRSGDHCQTSAGGGGDQYLRVSLQIYNTEAEIETLARVLGEITS